MAKSSRPARSRCSSPTSRARPRSSGGSATSMRACSSSTGTSCARRSRRAGGMEIDCRGDELLLVFTDAAAAVEGAVAAQRALAAHAWPEGGEVRVRMGIHTGEPTRRGRDLRRARRPPGRADQRRRPRRPGAPLGANAGARRGRDHGPRRAALSRPAGARARLPGRRGGAARGLPAAPARLEGGGNGRACVEAGRHARRPRRGLRAPARGDRAAARGRRASRSSARPAPATS